METPPPSSPPHVLSAATGSNGGGGPPPSGPSSLYSCNRMPSPTGMDHHRTTPRSSNAGSRPSSRPPSMPNSPASSHGHHSAHSSHSGHHQYAAPQPHQHNHNPHHHPYARHMNTPSPPPVHGSGSAPGSGPGSAPGSQQQQSPSSGTGSKVTPDAAARAARAQATGEAPLGPPTWRRMPCKARSVPEGHTAETAYLTIPPNAAHGLVLACSHPECRSSGKRFRFCTVCDLPVAKRNFLKRHSHGLVSPARSPRTDDDGAHEEEEEDVLSGDGSTSPIQSSNPSGDSKDKDGHDNTNDNGNRDSDGSNNGRAKSKSRSELRGKEIVRASSDNGSIANDVGASAPTSRSAFSSQFKRPREAGTTPPRDSDMDRDGHRGGGEYPPYRPPITHTMSWPPTDGHGHGTGPGHGYQQSNPNQTAAEAQREHEARGVANRLGLSPYGDRHGAPHQGPGSYHRQGYASPPGPHHRGGGAHHPPHPHMTHVHPGSFSPSMHPPPHRGHPGAGAGAGPPGGPPSQQYHDPHTTIGSPPSAEYDASPRSGAYRLPSSSHPGGPGPGPAPQRSPRPEDFDPPTPEYSVMRLSRREREWLQLFRTRPDSTDREATNAWVNRCLAQSETRVATESHDEAGGGVETILRTNRETYLLPNGNDSLSHSHSTVHVKNVVTPPNSHSHRQGVNVSSHSHLDASMDGIANVSNDTTGAGDVSPQRKNTGGSLSTLSITGESVTELLEHAGLMDNEDNDVDMVNASRRKKKEHGGGGDDNTDNTSGIFPHVAPGGSVSSADVSPISAGSKRGSFRIPPEGAPPMPSLELGAVRDEFRSSGGGSRESRGSSSGGGGHPDAVRASLMRAKTAGERAAAAAGSAQQQGRDRVGRAGSPREGGMTPDMESVEPNWGCFFPPLCGALNL